MIEAGLVDKMKLQHILEYEVKTCTFLMSFMYLVFPRMLIGKCERKLKRLDYYKQQSAVEEIKEYLVIK